jgi:hypothetical protein
VGLASLDSWAVIDPCDLALVAVGGTTRGDSFTTRVGASAATLLGLATVFCSVIADRSALAVAVVSRLAGTKVGIDCATSVDPSWPATVFGAAFAPPSSLIATDLGGSTIAGADSRSATRGSELSAMAGAGVAMGLGTATDFSSAPAIELVVGVPSRIAGGECVGIAIAIRVESPRSASVVGAGLASRGAGTVIEPGE